MSLLALEQTICNRSIASEVIFKKMGKNDLPKINIAQKSANYVQIS